MRKYTLLSCLMFLCARCPVAAQTDSLLRVLDMLVETDALYETKKLEHIALIKKELREPHLSWEYTYHVHSLLYKEYESFVCDSALHYINVNIDMARRNGRHDLENEAKLKKVHILAISGLYAEGLELLQSIDKRALSATHQADYYLAFADIYLYHSEYAQEHEYTPIYLRRMNAYRDSVLAVVEQGSYKDVITRAPMLLERGQSTEARALLTAFRQQMEPYTREYAVVCSILAFVCQYTGEKELRKQYLAQSAIADIKEAVKENNSLRVLAELLYEEGQIERANKYIKKSLADASFYNARLRNVQIAKTLPVIDSAYQAEREQARRQLQRFLAIISLLAFFLVVAVGYVWIQMRRLARMRREVMRANQELCRLNEVLAKANRQQQGMNHALTETNRIKEEYLGRFLGLCSTYIDKLESYRRMLNRKAAGGRLEELYKTLKSNQLIEEELKDFYRNFDSSFLNIYPDFVTRFNELLPPAEQLVPKQPNALTTELRIFALIRLGIADSAQIADFLHFSITTIYTYRSKVRNKSLYKEDFEERVMQIGSFKL